MFKKGDKLKCVNGSEIVNVSDGKHYIAEADQDGNYIKVYNDSRNLKDALANRFILASADALGFIIVTPADKTVNILGNTLSFGAIEELYNEIKKHK